MPASASTSAETTPEETSTFVVDTDLKGVSTAARPPPNHDSKKKGSIINIASMSGTVANYPRNKPITTRQAGVILLTKCLAIEWVGYNIRVIASAPAIPAPK